MLASNTSDEDRPIERSVFVLSPEFDSDQTDEEEEQAAAEEERSESLSSSSSSSIGKNSDDDSSGGGGGDEEEVQSEYKGGPLDSLEALEEVLPVKKSISKFYCGKSKSFTSLSDAVSCSSVTEIIKPENAYTRKRKNLLAFNHLWDSTRNNILRNKPGGISNRPINSRSMLSLAVTANSSDSNSGDTSNLHSSSPGSCLPPLPPLARKSVHAEMFPPAPVHKFPSWRTCSLSDLQGAAATDDSGPDITGLWMNNGDK